MAKTNITLYSSTPSSNTDINSINIDENCPASGLNNAIRELMAHLKNVDTGSQALTALSVTGALSCGAFTSNGIDDNADATVMTVSTGGFTLSPATNNLYQSDGALSYYATTNNVYLTGAGSGGGLLLSGDGTREENISISATNTNIRFTTGNSERMRIDGSGVVMIDTIHNNVTTVDGRHGIVFHHNTVNAYAGVAQFSANGTSGIRVNRDADDGSLVAFYQNANLEGTISVSGSTVSYNAFSGSHWSRLSDNSNPTILAGTIIETIDEMCDWYQAEFQIQEEGETRTARQSIALPSDASVGDTLTVSFEGNDYTATIVKEADNKHTKCKISDTADSTRVYGVFADWDNDDDTVNDMYVTSCGTHVVRINKDVTVQAGDLLSSNGDGTAKVQDDDIIRSKTIGKVLTNIKQETYDDGSYTVPCALYCG